MNAGVGTYGRLIEKPPAVDRETLEVNIVANVHLLQALLPDMIDRARREGRWAGVIIVASMSAFNPDPGMSSYSASKTFLVRLVEALALELVDQPVQILALCPTFTETEFFERGGLPMPHYFEAPETVALEGLTALGQRTVHRAAGETPCSRYWQH